MNADREPNQDEAHQKLSAADRDKLGPVWDMSQERVFMENLLGQRFNFFVVFFSVVIAGSINSKSQFLAAIVLTVGVVIALLFARVLARTQEKLDLILQDLFTDPSHPAKIIDDRATKTTSKRRIIGHTIPRLCCGVLITYAAYSWICIFIPAARVP
jgi:disulfide bond formation protein DsbB